MFIVVYKKKHIKKVILSLIFFSGLSLPLTSSDHWPIGRINVESRGSNDRIDQCETSSQETRRLLGYISHVQKEQKKERLRRIKDIYYSKNSIEQREILLKRVNDIISDTVTLQEHIANEIRKKGHLKTLTEWNQVWFRLVSDEFPSMQSKCIEIEIKLEEIRSEIINPLKNFKNKIYDVEVMVEEFEDVFKFVTEASDLYHAQTISSSSCFCSVM